LEVTVAPRLRIIVASVCVAIFIVVLGPGGADAQRAVPRSPAPQARHAVPRPIPARPVPGGHYYYRGPNVYRPYYASPYYWYGGFYGGYYSYPFYFSAGVGPYAPYHYGYPWYPYSPWYPYDPAAALRLQVTPREAEVFVDGSYAGTVDDFDGSFQRLRLYPGDHTVEVFLPGFHTLTQGIYVQPGKTFTVRAALQPLTPGEPEQVRPSGGVGAQSRTPQARPSASPREYGGEEPGLRPEFGILALRVQPGDAVVTIDGNVWEPSDEAGPLVLQLVTGVHAIEIRKQGYRTYITEFAVRQGETTALNVAMTPSP
jgi:PEGA domain